MSNIYWTSTWAHCGGRRGSEKLYNLHFVFQWPIPHAQAVFFIYRIIVAVYAGTWLLYTVIKYPYAGDHFSLAYLTMWTYSVLAIHLVWAAGCVSYKMLKSNFVPRPSQLPSAGQTNLGYVNGDSNMQFKGHPAKGDTNGSLSNSDGVLQNGYASTTTASYTASNQTVDVSVDYAGLTNETPHRTTTWYMKLSWALFNICVMMAPVVTLVYFVLLYPYIANGPISATDLNVHGINSVIIIIELFFSGYPVRLLHLVYPLAYGGCYIIFSLIYWSFDRQNNVLYPMVLDWNHPESTAIVLSIVILVATPIMQLILFCLYRLRVYLCSKCNGWIILMTEWTKQYKVNTFTSSLGISRRVPTMSVSVLPEFILFR